MMADPGAVQERAQMKIVPLQMIVAALIAGLVTIAAIFRWLISSGQVHPSSQLADFLLPLLAIFAVSLLFAYGVVRQVMMKRLKSGARDIDSPGPSESSAVELFTQLTIIGAALTEGCGLLGTVVHLLTGSWLALGVLVLAVIVLLVRFPTRRRYEMFLAAVGISVIHNVDDMSP